MMEPSMVGCTVRFSAVAQDEMWGAWLTVKGFECRGGKTTLWTRRPRVFRESELGSRTIVHEVSLTTGEEQTVGKTLIGIMWPRWQTGHSRRERPVSLSYRSR